MDNIASLLAPLQPILNLLPTIGIILIIVSMLMGRNPNFRFAKHLNIAIVTISVPLCLLAIMSVMAGSTSAILGAIIWGLNAWMSWRRL
jgi:hypothetical protein